MEFRPPSYQHVDDSPPDYEASESSTSHPQWGATPLIDRNLPLSFLIGGKRCNPFVKPSDLKTYLILLAAFHRLKEEVESHKSIGLSYRMDPVEAWTVFLERAVHRFDCWVSKVVGEGNEPRQLAEHELPPLDVTMVWHAYILNPRVYYDDCLRRLHGLHRIG